MCCSLLTVAVVRLGVLKACKLEPGWTRGTEDAGRSLLLQGVNRQMLHIIRESIPRSEVAKLAENLFGDMVKAVVDVARRVIAVGGELHSDEEAALLEDGSKQEHLWGINLYLGEPRDDWIEFDSMINVRPSQGNRSRDVEDPKIRDAIGRIVEELIEE